MKPKIKIQVILLIKANANWRIVHFPFQFILHEGSYVYEEVPPQKKSF